MLFSTSFGFVYPYSFAGTFVISIFISFSKVFKVLHTALCSKLLVITWSPFFKIPLNARFIDSVTFDVNITFFGFLKLNNSPINFLVSYTRKSDLMAILYDPLPELVPLFIIKSYIDFAKSITSSNDGITFGEFAKILNNDDKKIGRNSLYKWFRDKGYVIKNGSERNIPKQKYVNRGLFKVEEKIVMTRNGEKISTKVLITGKGQKYFKERFDF